MAYHETKRFVWACLLLVCLNAYHIRSLISPSKTTRCVFWCCFSLYHHYHTHTTIQLYYRTITPIQQYNSITPLSHPYSNTITPLSTPIQQYNSITSLSHPYNNTTLLPHHHTHTTVQLYYPTITPIQQYNYPIIHTHTATAIQLYSLQLPHYPHPYSNTTLLPHYHTHTTILPQHHTHTTIQIYYPTIRPIQKYNSITQLSHPITSIQNTTITPVTPIQNNITLLPHYHTHTAIQLYCPTITPIQQYNSITPLSHPYSNTTLLSRTSHTRAKCDYLALRPFTHTRQSLKQNTRKGKILF